MFSENASDEFTSTVGIISNVLMTVFLLLVVAFSIFSDDYPHTYAPRKSSPLGTIAMLAAAACGYSSILGLISDDMPNYSGTGGIFLTVLGLLTVLSMMIYSLTFYKGENYILSMSVVPIAPALWYGYRMLSAFLRSASMADISDQLPVIAMCCSFTIFMLTIGKLFCCINSNSIKWGFAGGCIGTMTSLLYSVNWLVNDCASLNDLMMNPLVFADILMALFAIGTLFHISNPSEYFDDEEWDDYFYETYDLPKPNLILHTPVDELEEDSLLDDDINESPYIPVNTSIGGGQRNQSSRGGNNRRDQRQPVAPAAPSYIANPASYYGQYPPQTPLQPQRQYYPPAYPSYPVYPYQGITPPNAGYPAAYPAPQQQVEYVNPYDEAAAKYQYERRRAELQSRELEKLTGEVDSSIAKLQSNVIPINLSTPPPTNESLACQTRHSREEIFVWHRAMPSPARDSPIMLTVWSSKTAPPPPRLSTMTTNTHTNTTTPPTPPASDRISSIPRKEAQSVPAAEGSQTTAYFLPNDPTWLISSNVGFFYFLILYDRPWNNNVVIWLK